MVAQKADISHEWLHQKHNWPSFTRDPFGLSGTSIIMHRQDPRLLLEWSTALMEIHQEMPGRQSGNTSILWRGCLHVLSSWPLLFHIDLKSTDLSTMPGRSPNPALDGESRVSEIIAILSVTTSLSTLIVALRCYTRAFILKSFGPDDAVIVPAQVCCPLGDIWVLI